jgi:hypothetical protein
MTDHRYDRASILLKQKLEAESWAALATWRRPARAKRGNGQSTRG